MIFFFLDQDGEEMVEKSGIHLRGQFAFQLLFHRPGLEWILAMKVFQVIQAEALQVGYHLGMKVPQSIPVVAQDPAGSDQGFHPGF
jgi:hypothetical protein